MLQITPEAERKQQVLKGTDDAIKCRRCGHLITRGRWRVSIAGEQCLFVNPMGLRFHIFCFELAPGTNSTGRATGAHTWYPGYVWKVAQCKICSTHLGWHFGGGNTPAEFYGLIKDALNGHHNEGE